MQVLLAKLKTHSPYQKLLKLPYLRMHIFLTVSLTNYFKLAVLI
jgi:hypothetical protein